MHNALHISLVFPSPLLVQRNCQLLIYSVWILYILNFCIIMKIYYHNNSVFKIVKEYAKRLLFTYVLAFSYNLNWKSVRQKHWGQKTSVNIRTKKIMKLLVISNAFKHCKSAKLPWHQNIKLSFCPFVFFSLGLFVFCVFILFVFLPICLIVFFLSAFASFFLIVLLSFLF